MRHKKGGSVLVARFDKIVVVVKERCDVNAALSVNSVAHFYLSMIDFYYC